MNRPWMPLYVADYRRDTAHLSTAEHGAYLLLIMHYWATGGLPDDDRQLARIACMTNSEWRRTRPIVQAFFFDGWKHKRIEFELTEAARMSAAGRAGGKASGEARRQRSANDQRTADERSFNGCGNDPPTICEALPSHLQRKKESIPANAGSPPAGYAFESGVIKLKQKDFDTWKAAFTHLDLSAELLAMTEWAGTLEPGRWFPAVSNNLNKKNREVHSRIEQSKNGPEFKWKSGMEGIV